MLTVHNRWFTYTVDLHVHVVQLYVVVLCCVVLWILGWRIKKKFGDQKPAVKTCSAPGNTMFCFDEFYSCSVNEAWKISPVCLLKTEIVVCIDSSGGTNSDFLALNVQQISMNKLGMESFTYM